MFGIDDLLMAGAGMVSNTIGAISGYKAQKRGINDAIATEQKNITNLEPWQKAGEDALSAWKEKVMAGPGDFKASEGYTWELGQGQNAIDRSEAAAGNTGTGAARKSLARYTMGLASTEYDKFQDRYLKSLVPYQQLAGVGQWAVGNEIGVNNEIAGLQVDKGQAKANMFSTIGNSVRGGISDAVTLGNLGGGGVPMNTPMLSAPVSGKSLFSGSNFSLANPAYRGN
jgi:hypothetical protein